MEGLAYLHLALAHEESKNVDAVTRLPNLNVFRLLKQQKYICKAWLYGLSLSLTLMLVKILTTTLALEIGEHQYKPSNIVSNPIYKPELKQNFRNTSHQFQLSSFSTKKDKLTIQKYSQQHWSQQKLGRLKLHLVNDTPYLALIFLYEPGNDQPTRYANIKPYTSITLNARYTSWWRVSFNSEQKKSFVGDFYDQPSNSFQVKTSILNPIQEQKQSYQYLQIYTDIKATEPKDIAKFFAGIQQKLRSAKTLLDFGEITDDINKFKKYIMDEIFNIFKINPEEIYDELIGEIQNLLKKLAENKNKDLNKLKESEEWQQLQQIISCFSLLTPNSYKFETIENAFDKNEKIVFDLMDKYHFAILLEQDSQKKLQLISDSNPPKMKTSNMLSTVGSFLENCRKKSPSPLSYKIVLKNSGLTTCAR